MIAHPEQFERVEPLARYYCDKLHFAEEADLVGSKARREREGHNERSGRD
jgi:hypothetical protein